MKKIVVIVFLFFSASTFAQQPGSKDSIYKKVEYPAGYSAQLNVVYTTVQDWEGKMDLYLRPKGKRPSPLVINIHGGGWNHDVKESQTDFNAFFKKGFTVANIEYRLTGKATAPAAVEDARCALIYLIKNAKAYHIDVNKIVIMGNSAGAHLALMAGLLGNNHLFDTNCPGVDHIKVAAIIDEYGITDVWDWGYGPNVTSKSPIRWLGEKALDKDFAASVSPVTYVKSESPPVFIVHGDADPIVPYQESVALYHQLLSAGVKTKFVTIKGGLHGKFSTLQWTEINNDIMAFLSGIKSLQQ